MSKNYMLYFLLFVILVLGLSYILSKKTNNVNSEFYISPKGQNIERIKSVGLNNSSEDTLDILDKNKLEIPEVDLYAKNREYKADTNREFIIEIEKSNEEDITKKEILDFFDYEWRSNYRSTIYGYSGQEDRWTFATASDSPEKYEKIQIAINVFELYNDERSEFDKGKYKFYLDEIIRRIKKYPYQFEIGNIDEKGTIVYKVERLQELSEKYNHESIIVLKSEKGYDGKDVWDVLSSLGLEWGDGDIFHWNNHNSNYGADQFFSVWTSTKPNYFYPEEIMNGNMNPRDLIFGYSIPRSADPVNIYEVMVSSVKYCKSRMGGKLLNGEGELFDEELERERIQRIVAEMIKEGINPGSGEALRNF